MCLMCIEIQKDRMKAQEVVRALGEFVPPKDHEDELFSVIVDKFGQEAFAQAALDPELLKALEDLEEWYYGDLQ